MAPTPSDESCTVVLSPTSFIKTQMKGKKLIGFSHFAIHNPSNPMFSLVCSLLLLLMVAIISLTVIHEHRTWHHNTQYTLRYLQEQPYLAERSLRMGYQLSQFAGVTHISKEQHRLQEELSKTLVRMHVYHQLLLDEYYLPHHQKTTGLFMPKQTYKKLQRRFFNDSPSLSSLITRHYATLLPVQNVSSLRVINHYSATAYHDLMRQLNQIAEFAYEAQYEEQVYFQTKLGLLMIMMLLLTTALGLSLKAVRIQKSSKDTDLTGTAKRINGLLNKTATKSDLDNEENLFKARRC